MRRTLSSLLLLVSALVLVPAAKAAPPKDTLDMVALASTPSGVAPVNVSKKAWSYPSFCAVGDSFSQTFPVTLTVADGNGHPGDNRNVQFSATGTLAAYTTLPGNVSLPDDGSVNGPYNVVVNATGLAAGTYTLTVGVRAPNTFGLRKSFSVTVVVGSTCVGTYLSFYTDDQLNELNDCTASPVGSGTGGTFQIVPYGANASLVFATIPGTFYDHFIWTNTTANPIDVTLQLDSAHFTALADAHFKTFTAPTIDLATFQDVNTNGTACAANVCTTTVAAGDTLWATWGGTWDGIGGDTSTLSNTCPGNATLSNTNTLVSNAVTIAQSANSASGYLIPCPSGDVNGDGATNVIDVFYLINYLFSGGTAPTCGSGNVDGTGSADVADIFYLINYLFAGGAPPL